MQLIFNIISVRVAKKYKLIAESREAENKQLTRECNEVRIEKEDLQDLTNQLKQKTDMFTHRISKADQQVSDLKSSNKEFEAIIRELESKSSQYEFDLNAKDKMVALSFYSVILIVYAFIL